MTMMKYVNPKNGRAWETNRNDISPGGFVNVLNMHEGDVIECWHTDAQGAWRKFTSGILLYKGRMHMTDRIPPRRKRRRKK
jgi:hypothetical protein